MNKKEYITEYLPKKCGAHPSSGNTAWLVFCAERNGDPAYKADKFKNARERAKMGMPYAPARGRKKEYEKGLDVLELAILNHEQKEHLINNQPRITEIQTSRTFNPEEIDVLAADWWSA